MEHTQLIGISLILIFGIASQWFAWRLKLPSILLLLLTGIIIGPVFGIVDPDAIFGSLLFPIVSLSVAIILFEGGLALRLDDLQGVGRVVGKLISVGAITSFVLIVIFSHYLLQLSMSVSFLLGAVLIVTGPTVILPMLKHVRVNKDLAAILRWECVSIDVVGAVLAVLVYEVMFVNSFQMAIGLTIFKFIVTILSGTILGVLGGVAIVQLFKRHLAPEFLHESITLAVVFLVFLLSNEIQAESGLLAVMVMGILLANQKQVELVNVIKFKENLTVILLSSLFVFLAARLEFDLILQFVNWRMGAFLLALIVVVRPLSVVASTIGSSLTKRDVLFLSWMAPRGIVAAAVSSFFALKLSGAGIEGAEKLVSVTFLVIITTVALYGLTGRFVARLLNVTKRAYRGIMIVGAHDLAQMIAQALKSAGIEVLLVDTNKMHVLSARSNGIPALHGSVLSQNILDEVETFGLGRLFAITPSDEVNLLAALEYVTIFGPANVFRLSVSKKYQFGGGASPKKRPGRVLFGNGVSYTVMMAKLTAGAVIKLVPVGDDVCVDEYIEKNERSLPLFVVTQKGRLIVFTDDFPVHHSDVAQYLVVLE